MKNTNVRLKEALEKMQSLENIVKKLKKENDELKSRNYYLRANENQNKNAVLTKNTSVVGDSSFS